MLQGSPCLIETLRLDVNFFSLTKMIFVLNNSSTFYNFHLPLIYVYLFVLFFKACLINKL